MEENKNYLIDWNDEISNEGQEFVTLEEGDYLFRVIKFERGRYLGSAKIPPCNKAIITVEVPTEKGVAIAKVDLILYRTLEWKLCAFFRCIGQKKHGEKLVMDWNKVLGAVGKAHFKPRTYTNQNGEERIINDIEKFIDYDEEFFKEQGLDNQIEISDDDLPF